MDQKFVEYANGYAAGALAERANVIKELRHFLRCDCRPDFPAPRHASTCMAWVIDEVTEPREDLHCEPEARDP